jgi:serine/threonine-protein kinase
MSGFRDNFFNYKKVEILKRRKLKVSKGMIKFLAHVFVSFIVSILVCLSFYFYLTPILDRMKNVEVPNLIGSSLEQSRLMLESKKLLLILEGEKESNLVPEGKVVEQIPLGGAIVTGGFKVNVFVSKRKTKLPDFSGVLVEDVKVKLKELGLELGKEENVYSETISSGKVVSTLPAYNSEVKKGEEINLLISSGSGKVRVPNLLGKKLTSVQVLLKRAGLKMGEIKHACDEERVFDIVLRQNPRSGREVNRRSSVNITINSEEAE